MYIFRLCTGIFSDQLSVLVSPLQVWMFHNVRSISPSDLPMYSIHASFSRGSCQVSLWLAVLCDISHTKQFIYTNDAYTWLAWKYVSSLCQNMSRASFNMEWGPETPFLFPEGPDTQTLMKLRLGIWTTQLFRSTVTCLLWLLLLSALNFLRQENKLRMISHWRYNTAVIHLLHSFSGS